MRWCFSHSYTSDILQFNGDCTKIFLFWFAVETFRASSMEEKHKLFWNQGDFGYVKSVTDSVMPICGPEKEVCVWTKMSHEQGMGLGFEHIWD